MSALGELIKAVDVDEATAQHFMDLFMRGRPGDMDTTRDALHAYSGSLDAAKRLHDALLPGWHWRADDGQGQECPFWHVFKFGGTRRDIGEGESETPSRAWLLAILRALRALQSMEAQVAKGDG